MKPAGGDQLATLLASADPTRGADVAKKCAICHNFDKGGPNMIGPNLYGVLGRKIASHEGYEYSDALKAKGGETWDYEKINHMIENPNAFVPGTKMALFPGLPDAKQRADVLVFLRTKNDNPPPLPEAKPEATPSGEDDSPTAKRRRSGGRRCSLPRADRQGRPETGRSRCRGLQGLPQVRQGRRPLIGSRSLWRGRTQDRLGRGFQLHARAEGA